MLMSFNFHGCQPPGVTVEALMADQPVHNYGHKLKGHVSVASFAFEYTTHLQCLHWNHWY